MDLRKTFQGINFHNFISHSRGCVFTVIFNINTGKEKNVLFEFYIDEILK